MRSYAYELPEKISDEWEWWKEQYSKSLKDEIFGAEKKRNSCGSVYCDPDEGNEEYYSKICLFLNKQEKKYFNENNEFHYCVGSFKKKSRIHVCKNGKYLFSLKTDQFGFSVPRVENSPNPESVMPHPYSLYYKGESDKEEALKNITKWVYLSRSIGGSFLWPEEENAYQPPYNIKRGGSQNLRGSSYINDRVDLTLLELSHFYKILKNRPDDNLNDFIDEYRKNFPRDILGELVLNKSPNLFVWLKHFETFDKYIKFFEFSMFIRDEKIINICNGKEEEVIEEPKDPQAKKEVKKQLKEQFWESNFKNVLSFVCQRIACRSRKIECILE